MNYFLEREQPHQALHSARVNMRILLCILPLTEHQVLLSLGAKINQKWAERKVTV